MTRHVYVFAVSAGYVKIGFTADIKARDYQLRWGERPPYVTWPTEQGEIVYHMELGSTFEARRIERAWQKLFDQWRVATSARGGGAPEWFRIERDRALAELARVDWSDPLEVERCLALAPNRPTPQARHNRRAGSSGELLVHINTKIFKAQDAAIDTIVEEGYGISRAAVIRELIALGLEAKAKKRK